MTFLFCRRANRKRATDPRQTQNSHRISSYPAWETVKNGRFLLGKSLRPNSSTLFLNIFACLKNFILCYTATSPDPLFGSPKGAWIAPTPLSLDHLDDVAKGQTTPAISRSIYEAFSLPDTMEHFCLTCSVIPLCI